MKQPKSFGLLFRMFLDRFFVNDTASPTGDFDTNIYQVLGFLATPGVFIASFLMWPFLRLYVEHSTPAADWAFRIQRLFFPAFSFATIGFATLFEWDMLVPDRRDFLILAPFPIRSRDIFAAKVSALGVFLLSLITAVNLFPTLVLILFSVVDPQFRGTALTMIMTWVAATLGASAFAFLLVAALQGVLLAITSPSVFRAISPVVQMLGMSLMVLTLLTYPIYSLLLPSAAHAHSTWLWFVPPIWFTSLYDLVLPNAYAIFVDLGRLAGRAFVVTFAVFAIAWLLGFRRHYRKTLEAEDTGSKLAPSLGFRLSRMLQRPEERALFEFTGKTLARSTKHQLFLVTYLSVGIAIGLLFACAVKDGKLIWPVDGLRAFPFFVSFFVVSGLRTVFQFPSNLASNWLFQITEAQWTEPSRSAVRKRVLCSGLVSTVILLIPLELVVWGWRVGLLHTAFHLVIGALLVEIMFWSFDKVPFTCSYFAGKIHLSLLAGLYLYGFTTYSFQMADLEAALDHHGGMTLPFFAVALGLLWLSWRRRTPSSAVVFDATEPAIQGLNLDF